MKSFAIVLVVMGHCIQYGSGNNFIINQNFFNSTLFKTIYSFHMPLFMIISGYLFYNSINKYESKEIVKRKLNSLLVPVISFSIINSAIHLFSGSTLSVSFLISMFIDYVWFLWAVLLLSIVVVINKTFFKDNILIYCILFILTFFAPTYMSIHLIAYVYPFFIAGYIFNKFKIKIPSKVIFISSILFLILFIVLIKFYNYDSYIYTTGMSIIGNKHQLLIDLYRLLIGFVGSAMCILFVNTVCMCIKKIPSIIIELSNATLGIYLFSILVNLVLVKITYNFNGINYLYLLIETIVVLIICMIIIFIIKKSKLLSRLFLGISK